LRRLLTLTAIAAGIFAALLPAAEAQTAPDATRLRICAGSATGNYTFAANEIQKRLGPSTFSGGVTVIHTAGSLDNLRRLMSGDCDVGFSQSDVAARFIAENSAAMNSLRRFTSLYREYVHLICPVASGFTRVNDMGKASQSTGARLIVGGDGSGTAESWRAMRQADAALYDRVERIPESVGRASLAQVRDSRNTCMLWISGLNSPDMQAASAMSVNNPRRTPTLRLVDFNDRDITNLRGPDGRPLYEVAELRRVAPRGDNPGRYANLIEGGWTSSGSVNVLTVGAELMMREDFRRALGGRADALVQAIEDAAPTINARVNPQ
jgi:TRAP-type uncharacterized transport system substrate-binding protein